MVVPIPLRFSNVYLVVGEDKAVLVDTGCRNQYRQILAKIDASGVSRNRISCIVHTHIHPDHCGSTAELSQILGVPTLIHKYEAEALDSGRIRALNPNNIEGVLLKPFVRKLGIAPFTPDHCIDADTHCLKRFGVYARLELTPGHTSGSVSIIDSGSNSAIVGDLMMGGYCFNLIDPAVPRQPSFVQDRRLLQWSIKKLLALDLQYWYPGHGGRLEVKRIKERFPV